MEENPGRLGKFHTGDYSRIGIYTYDYNISSINQVAYSSRQAGRLENLPKHDTPEV